MNRHILFESRPGISLALAPDAPKFTVVAATDDFIQVSSVTREAVIGKGLFEVPARVYLETFLAHREVLIASLQSVIDDKKPHQLPFRQYYPPDKGREHASYLQVRNIPVLDEDGELLYIILNWENITAEIKEEHTQIKFKDIGNAYDLLMQAPLVIGMVKGRDHVLELANKEAFKLWGHGPEMIGKPLLESVPELKGQGIIELFDLVMNAGQTYTRRALPVKAIVNGQEHLHYFDIVYQPVLDEVGKNVIGVFTISHEVTAIVEAEKKSRQSEERLHTALETAHMGTWDTNLVTGTMVVSDEFKTIFGLRKDKEYNYDVFLGQVVDEDRARTSEVNADVMNLKNGRSDYELQYRIRRADDGEVRWIHARGKVHTDQEGKPYRFTGVAMDITPQKHAQERFQYIFNSVPVAIWDQDCSALVAAVDELKHTYGDGLRRYLEDNTSEVYRLMRLIKTRAINEASLKMFDAERREDLITGLANVFTDEAVPAFIEELMAVAERAKTYQAEFILQTLKGRKVPFLTTISFPNDKYDSVLVCRYDISDLKKTEEALRESEERFRTMANAIPQLAWITDKTGSIYWYNDRWYNYTGTTPDEMLGWGWKKVHHPDMVDGVEKRFKEAIDAGREWEDTFLLRSKTGEYRWFLSRAIPVRDGDNVITGWFGTNTDITDQRKTAQALKEREEQLQLAIQGGELGIYDYDPITGEMSWSKRMKELFGIPAGAPVNYEAYLNALHPEDREQAHRAVQASFLQQQGGRYENEYRVIVDGKVRWIRSKGRAFFDEHGKAYRTAGVSMDITAQKEAEEALRQSEQLFRTLVENLPQLIFVSNADGVAEYAGQRWKKYLEDRVTTDGLQQIIHPADWPFFISNWENSLKTGRPVVAECRLKSKKGKYRWFSVHGEPVRDEKGKIDKWITAFTDIDDQKSFTKKLEKLVSDRTRELKKSNEELQRFVYVSSHDFKEPVRKIMLFTGKLEQDLKAEQNEIVQFSLKTIRASALRLMAILQGVIKYSAVNVIKNTFKNVDLNEIIQQVEADLALEIQQKKAVINCGKLPRLRGIKDLLHLVFYNLISNSLKFAKREVQPVITITSETREQKGKTMACIFVVDNGIGFKQEYAEKIFSSFTRLQSHDMYQGVGLGLSLCRKIIEQHGGTITAQSTEGSGAEFQILLPLGS